MLSDPKIQQFSLKISYKQRKEKIDQKLTIKSAGELSITSEICIKI